MSALERRPGALALGGGLLWAGLNLVWLSQDHVPRDGDEQGHVGAAELFRALWAEGQVGAALGGALAGDYGEYPPLWPGLLGAAWALLGGTPEGLLLRAFPLISVVVTAFAVADLTMGLLRRGPEARPAAALAGLLCLLMPLPVGVARHYMPEAPLMAAVSLSLALGLRAAEAPRWGRLLAWGLSLGLAGLIKQTAALALAAPTLFLAWRIGPRALVGLGVGALVVAPWLIQNIAQQQIYAQTSVIGSDGGGDGGGGEGGGAPLWAHLLHTPSQLIFVGLGPVLSLAALRYGPAGLRAARGTGGRLLLVWLLGGALLLTLIPKKYPRLILPICPAVLPLLAIGLAQRPRREGLLVLGGGAAGLTLMSLVALPEAPLSRRLDPRCPQTWLGPPDPDDLGLSATVAAIAAAPPGPVAVFAPPPIPCAVQSTHDWIEHLGPRLRYEGVERDILIDPSPEEAAGAGFVLRFDAAGRPRLPPPRAAAAPW